MILAVDVFLEANNMVEHLCLLVTAFLVDRVRSDGQVRTTPGVIGQVLLEITLSVPSKTLRLQPLIYDPSHIKSAHCLTEAVLAHFRAPSSLISAIAKCNKAILAIVCILILVAGSDDGQLLHASVLRHLILAEISWRIGRLG